MSLSNFAKRTWSTSVAIAESRKNWEFFFHAAQGLGAVVLTAIAIWGVFFTSIPETLIRQYQSEVAQTKEEVTSLMRDRRMLLDQVQEAESNLKQALAKQNDAERALAQAQSELATVHNDISMLATQRDELSKERATALEELASLQKQVKLAQNQLASALAERDKYLGVAFGKATEQILSALSAQANQLSRELNDAELLQRIPEFADRDKELGERLKGISDPVQKRNIIELWSSKYSDDRDWLMWSLGDADPVAESSRLRTLIVNASKDVAPTGVTIMSDLLKRESFVYLLDHDWALFRSVVLSLVESERTLISSSLRISLKEGFTDQELASEIKRTQRAISDLRRFIALLQDTLVAKLSKA